MDIVDGWHAICFTKTSLPSRCKSSMTQGAAIGWNCSCAHGHLRVGGNRPQSLNHPFLRSRRPGFGPLVIINVRRQGLSRHKEAVPHAGRWQVWTARHERVAGPAGRQSFVARVATSRTADARHNPASVSPEWPLVKAPIIAGTAFPVTAAVRDFYEAAARLIEQWVGFEIGRAHV